MIRSEVWLYQTFCTFLRYYHGTTPVSNHRVDVTILALLQDNEYILYRKWPCLHDDPWRIPWKTGEVVSMSAVCCGDGDRDGTHYCVRCRRYNCLDAGGNWDDKREIEW